MTKETCPWDFFLVFFHTEMKPEARAKARTNKLFLSHFLIIDYLAGRSTLKTWPKSASTTDPCLAAAVFFTASTAAAASAASDRACASPSAAAEEAAAAVLASRAAR